MSAKKGVSPLNFHKGPELELCSRERMIELLGVKMEEYRRNYICLKNKGDATIYSNHL